MAEESFFVLGVMDKGSGRIWNVRLRRKRRNIYLPYVSTSCVSKIALNSVCENTVLDSGKRGESSEAST